MSLNLENAPEWYTDLLLETITELAQNNKKEKFQKYRNLVIQSDQKDVSIRGYGILTSDTNEFIFIGRKHRQASDGPITDYYKIITPFENILTS